MSDKKLRKIDLYGICNLLKQLLDKNMISRDECDTIFHRIAEENDYSETDISLFKGYIHGKNLTSGSQIRKV